ncbi:hypothetical protein AOXY_G11517 [Acipenser oxyrinchus oxyrinchus]|uniref:Uncharacterized protein n=1 Tax=Acipenser oxyrinchus oxyrinchus TaxID=40147 RepID=A0AAD8G745_ACIOX|nr:hypothetical protein AOXY_G11517 [Acipenser oxyrinchus oxyrinchus]
MNAVLSFSLFLFSCALVFPRPFNTTQENVLTRGDNKVYLETNKTQGNVTIGNGTVNGTVNATSHTNDTSTDNYLTPFCLLPTCGLDNLAQMLQIGSGDETAGSSVNNPYGNGKKK